MLTQGLTEIPRHHFSLTHCIIAIAMLSIEAVAIDGPVHAQTSPTAVEGVFEVASVKANESGGRLFGAFGPQPGGRFVMVNGTVRALIGYGYVPGQSDVIGLPGWVDSERYDVQAKAAGPASVAEMRSMVRALLADRFQLQARWEMREEDTYALVLARDDGRLGPNLRQIDVDCDALGDALASGSITADAIPEAQNGAPVCVGQTTTRSTPSGSVVISKSGGRRMSTLAGSLGGSAGRPVVDKTGLEGFYESTLESRRDASIFTLVQEQWGLKLVAERNPVPVLVVDRVERPSED
jgi:uncharacterized protein (TIGR03435 family)